MIMQPNPNLGRLWAEHLARVGLATVHVADQDQAMSVLAHEEFPVIVLDVGEDGAISVSDYCSYRWPNSRVIFVTSATFFSDGSIFSHCANACAFIPKTTQPSDIAEMITYYAGDTAP